MTYNNIYRFAYVSSILLGISILYRKYQEKNERQDSSNDNKIIQQYLLNENTLEKSKKPVIWIHLPYEVNAREWESFESRNTSNLNAPYMHLTIKSIIQHCKSSFHICIIDDDSFETLLPSWNIRIQDTSGPIKTNIRSLGLYKILQKYGGLLLPPSFLCMKNLKTVYNEGLNIHDMFSFEIPATNSASSLVNSFPSKSLIGCKKNCTAINNLVQFTENVISQDNSNESLFHDNISRCIFELHLQEKVRLIDGSKIGLFDKNGNNIEICDLLAMQEIQFVNNLCGIYIKHEEIVKKLDLQWFLRLSIDDIIESNMVISEYIVESIATV
jgi:hypothetical protein